MDPLADANVQIPVIDISDANSSDAPTQLLNAAHSFGFVFVKNDRNGIPPELIADMFDLSKAFFSLPTETKKEVSISSNKAGKNHGWLSQGVERLDPGGQKRPDVKEAFNMGLADAHSRRFEQPLPDVIEKRLHTVLSFQEACSALCRRILEFFAVALNIERDWFTSRHERAGGPTSSILRLLYYPKRHAEIDDVDIRAGAHSDYGSITCLFQLDGQPGLELKTPSGEWAAVPVNPLREVDLPILVNIGDLLEDWTGGLLKSTKHRVVFPQGESGDRYSIAYFCHPLDDALLEPVPSTIVEKHTASQGQPAIKARKLITAKDHLMERLAATYKV